MKNVWLTEGLALAVEALKLSAMFIVVLFLIWCSDCLLEKIQRETSDTETKTEETHVPAAALVKHK